MDYDSMPSPNDLIEKNRADDLNQASRNVSNQDEGPSVRPKVNRFNDVLGIREGKGEKLANRKGGASEENGVNGKCFGTDENGNFGRGDTTSKDANSDETEGLLKQCVKDWVLHGTASDQKSLLVNDRAMISGFNGLDNHDHDNGDGLIEALQRFQDPLTIPLVTQSFDLDDKTLDPTFEPNDSSSSASLESSKSPESSRSDESGRNAPLFAWTDSIRTSVEDNVIPSFPCTIERVVNSSVTKTIEQVSNSDSSPSSTSSPVKTNPATKSNSSINDVANEAMADLSQFNYSAMEDLPTSLNQDQTQMERELAFEFKVESAIIGRDCLLAAKDVVSVVALETNLDPQTEGSGEGASLNMSSLNLSSTADEADQTSGAESDSEGAKSALIVGEGPDSVKKPDFPLEDAVTSCVTSDLAIESPHNSENASTAVVEAFSSSVGNSLAPHDSGRDFVEDSSALQGISGATAALDSDFDAMTEASTPWRKSSALAQSDADSDSTKESTPPLRYASISAASGSDSGSAKETTPPPEDRPVFPSLTQRRTRPGLKIKIEEKEDAKMKAMNEMNEKAKFQTKARTRRIATPAERERILEERRRAAEEKEAREEAEKVAVDVRRSSRGLLHRGDRFDETDSVATVSCPSDVAAEVAIAAAEIVTAVLAGPGPVSAGGSESAPSGRKGLVDIANIFVNRKRELTSSPPPNSSHFDFAADGASAETPDPNHLRDDAFDCLWPDGDVLSRRSWTTQGISNEAMRGVPRIPRRVLLQRVLDNATQTPILIGFALGIFLFYALKMLLGKL